MSFQTKQETITGYIMTVPDGETEEGARASLQSDDGVVYFILPKGMGLDLMEHINAKAEVNGLVEERGGSRFILVRNYAVQDGFEDDWYDDND